MYITLGICEINFIPAFSKQRPELGPHLYDIASRCTLVKGVLDKTASKSDFIGALEHCNSIVLHGGTRVSPLIKSMGKNTLLRHGQKSKLQCLCTYV